MNNAVRRLIWIAAFVLAISLLLTLAGCSGNKGAGNSSAVSESPTDTANLSAAGSGAQSKPKDEVSAGQEQAVQMEQQGGAK